MLAVWIVLEGAWIFELRDSLTRFTRMQFDQLALAWLLTGQLTFQPSVLLNLHFSPLRGDDRSCVHNNSCKSTAVKNESPKENFAFLQISSPRSRDKWQRCCADQAALPFSMAPNDGANNTNDYSPFPFRLWFDGLVENVRNLEQKLDKFALCSNTKSLNRVIGHLMIHRIVSIAVECVSTSVLLLTN